MTGALRGRRSPVLYMPLTTDRIPNRVAHPAPARRVHGGSPRLSESGRHLPDSERDVQLVLVLARACTATSCASCPPSPSRVSEPLEPPQRDPHTPESDRRNGRHQNEVERPFFCRFATPLDPIHFSTRNRLVFRQPAAPHPRFDRPRPARGHQRASTPRLAPSRAPAPACLPACLPPLRP